MMKTCALFCVIACASGNTLGASSSIMKNALAGQYKGDGTHANGNTGNDGTCAWGTTGSSSKAGLTCSYPQHTTYANAFVLAQSLHNCDDAAWQSSQGTSAVTTHAHALKTNNQKSSWHNGDAQASCYDSTLCMFCFRHTDEFWLLEGALGIKVPKCEDNDTNKVGSPRTMHCPTQTDMATWKTAHAESSDTALANKIAEFWGDRYYNTPKFTGGANTLQDGSTGAGNSVSDTIVN